MSFKASFDKMLMNLADSNPFALLYGIAHDEGRDERRDQTKFNDDRKR